MTGNQDKFATLVALGDAEHPNGMDHTEAYRQAGYSTQNMLPATLYQEAYQLSIHPQVSLRIEELKEAKQSEDQDLRGIATKALVATLGAATSGLPRHSDKVNAADKLLKLTGAYREPEAKPQGTTVTNVTVVLNRGN